MSIYTLNPLTDSRWPEFLDRHPSASIFHTPGWLTALQRTYGYEPLVLTSSPPGAELTDGIAFCRISSNLQGTRLISLPFSDHCEPLANSDACLQRLLAELGPWQAQMSCRYSELRPLRAIPAATAGFGPGASFFMHELALQSDAAAVFRGFSKDSIQRKIKRGERENLVCKEGRSKDLIEAFYRLQLLTRRRHGLPPQPMEWFEELARCLGESMKIRAAFRDGVPIAAIVTLRFKQTMVYKYGSSDAAHHNTGALQLLFWNAIRESIDSGLECFDFGRSDLDNDGLVTFKDRWGATRSLLAYWNNPPVSGASRNSFIRPLAQSIFQRVPDPLLTVAGRLLYKHFL
jgi:CelD/BcsL family acetyltransferase involved in cellulose biosynthesis